jgi:hypothetical protein
MELTHINLCRVDLNNELEENAVALSLLDFIPPIDPFQSAALNFDNAPQFTTVDHKRQRLSSQEEWTPTPIKGKTLRVPESKDVMPRITMELAYIDLCSVNFDNAPVVKTAMSITLRGKETNVENFNFRLDRDWGGLGLDFGVELSGFNFCVCV